MASRDGAKRTMWLFVKETAIIVVGALIASTLLRMFLLQVFVIPSRSMEQTLLVGDRVAVQKVVGFQRGDVVVFRDDLGWLGEPPNHDPKWWQRGLTFVGLLPDESAGYLIKRVIGMPGDRIVCCDKDGLMQVNGHSLFEVSYLYQDPVTGVTDKPSEYSFDVVVPKDHIFVMGDHRNASADSRCHLDESVAGVAHAGAFVHTDAVIGSAVALVTPFHRWRTFLVPEPFSQIPPPLEPAPDSPVVTADPINC